MLQSIAGLEVVDATFYIWKVKYLVAKIWLIQWSVYCVVLIDWMLKIIIIIIILRGTH